MPGRAGWLLSHYVDVDAPDSLTRYAEGQRFVGAYVLTTVHDDGAEQDNKDIPIYLTVLSPYTAGLPYDFDQVRVFTWNLKMHRYETAFREKNVEGYLPVSIKMSADPMGGRRPRRPAAGVQLQGPGRRRQAGGPDPATGMVTPDGPSRRPIGWRGTWCGGSQRRKQRRAGGASRHRGEKSRQGEEEVRRSCWLLVGMDQA